MDGRVYLVCFTIPNGFGNTAITIRKHNFTKLELLDDYNKRAALSRERKLCDNKHN